VEPGDLRALLRASDVLIHPSPVQDPFPNAVLEGMAAGMAVLGSSACGSVVDRVSPGVSGLVHDSGSIDGLARDIEWCLRNPAAVADMGRRCESIAARWPVERSVEIVRDLADGRFPPLATAPWPASEEKAS
jgi:glycosyltransferase involved in cell wall biosynthesis